MKTPILKFLATGFVLVQAALLANAQSPQDLTWRVTFKPEAKASLSYEINGNIFGELLTSGSIQIPRDAQIQMTFYPVDGYLISSIKKDGRELLLRSPASISQQAFGPIDSSEAIVVSCVPQNPVGDFVLGSDIASGRPSPPTVMGDISGTYTGDMPDRNLGPDGKRPYSADIAMDESGKLDVMGTVDGVNNKDGLPQLDAGGAVKTIGGKPKAEYKGSGRGTIDNAPSSGGGSATLPLELTNTGGTPSTDGVAKGAVNEDGTKYSEKATPVSVPIKPGEAGQVKSTWSFYLMFTEETDANGKTAVYAAGILNLTDGTRTSFAKKKTKYSAKSGYAVAFAKGTKVDSGGFPIPDHRGNPTKDKKSTVSIKKMTLTKSVATWVPNAGTINYKFLGQKGSGNVVDFLP